MKHNGPGEPAQLGSTRFGRLANEAKDRRMLNLEDLMMRGNYANTTAATSASATLTAGGLLKLLTQMQRVMRELDAVAPSGPLQVRESPTALQAVPVKRHKKRRNQTEAYHLRVQKKWTKRHGTKQVPAAYMLDNSVIGGYGQTLVAHPSIVARLKTPNGMLTAPTEAQRTEP